MGGQGVCGQERDRFHPSRDCMGNDLSLGAIKNPARTGSKERGTSRWWSRKVICFSRPRRWKKAERGRLFRGHKRTAVGFRSAVHGKGHWLRQQSPFARQGRQHRKGPCYSGLVVFGIDLPSDLRLLSVSGCKRKVVGLRPPTAKTQASVGSAGNSNFLPIMQAGVR